MKFCFKLFFIFFIVSFYSCTLGSVKEEELRQHENIKKAILNSFRNEVKVYIYPFKNNTKTEDLNYLTNALQDLMINYLKTLETETMYVPFDKVNITVTPEIDACFQIINTIFTNYITNIEVSITQYQEQIFTNETISITTNTNIVETGDKKKKPLRQILLSFSTNTNLLVVTNKMISNIIQTNTNLITKEKFVELFKKEFIDLTNEICNLPISIQKGSPDTESNASQPFYYFNVYGSFDLLSRKVGPNELKVNVTLEEYSYRTNKSSLSIASREDLLSEKLLSFLKTTRNFILNKPTGDIIIHTEPEDANVYYDGTFIGKSPLYYPAIPAGKHQFSFLKQGFQHTVVQADITKDKTNVITKSIEKMRIGGIVHINSSPTNANVFMDSYYIGNTPIVLSNLTMETYHRVKIQPQETNRNPFYHSFVIKSTNQEYYINASFSEYEGSPTWLRKTLWYSVYASWGITLGYVGVNIYAHYMKEHYLDLYYSTTNLDYADKASYYADLYENSNTWGLISALASLGLTAIALYNEEVYLGLRWNGPSSISTYIAFQF